MEQQSVTYKIVCQTSNWSPFYCSIKLQGDIHPPRTLYHFHEEEHTAP